MPGIVTGNKIPLYHQVAQTLKQRVRTGQYRTGRSLPPIRTLSEEFGVSSKVVHRAVRLLEGSGIVVTHHGKGMKVRDDRPCEEAAIIFGFIHPYGSSEGFSRSVLGYLADAFENRSNFAVARSSKDDPVLERRIAEHLIANGVRGLIVWPTNDDPNGGYFTELANKIPVVLVDRLLAGANLPSVVHDYFACGREVCEELLGKRRKNRLLVLMDNLRISGYQETIRGIERAAEEMGRSADVTVVQLPITEKIFAKTSAADFSEVEPSARYVDRLMKEGGYDAVFCNQGEFIEHVMVQTGLMDTFPGVQLATISSGGVHTGTQRYYSFSPLEWDSDSEKMVSQAADLVQRWVLTRRMPQETIRLKLRLPDRPPRQADPVTG